MSPAVYSLPPFLLLSLPLSFFISSWRGLSAKSWPAHNHEELPFSLPLHLPPSFQWQHQITKKNNHAKHYLNCTTTVYFAKQGFLFIVIYCFFNVLYFVTIFPNLTVFTSFALLVLFFFVFFSTGPVQPYSFRQLTVLLKDNKQPISDTESAFA